MTREEAVKVIENRDSIMDYCESAELGEALDMAINALSEIEDIKAELQQLADDEWNQRVGSVSQGLEYAIEIIDNHISGKESE